MHRRDRLAPTVKHEARAFDGSRPCSRDVIVNFIRKPLVDGSDKGPQEISIKGILILIRTDLPITGGSRLGWA